MKYILLKDCMDGKAGEVKEIRAELSDMLLKMGYIEEYKDKEKKTTKSE